MKAVAFAALYLTALGLLFNWLWKVAKRRTAQRNDNTSSDFSPSLDSGISLDVIDAICDAASDCGGSDCSSSD